MTGARGVTTAHGRPGGVLEIRRRLVRGEISVSEHLAATLTAITRVDPWLRAFLSVTGERAHRDAERAAQRIRALGAEAWRERPLLGVTVAVKDLIQTRDLPTTRGSLLPNPRPAADAPAVARLRRAGAIIIGKTTTSEYGWSASTVGRLALPTRNPWDPGRTAGGSSGGSAASVAAGLCDVALGTDGAGSIRIPAAFCGVVGFKPSFGRVPYVPPCADRLAHLGPICRTVSDVVELMRVLGGPDPEDPDSVSAARDTVGPRHACRIGWMEFPATTPAVRAASERAIPALRRRGHLVERIDVPFDDPYPVLVTLVAAAEAATAQADDGRADPARLAVVAHGRRLSAEALMRAEDARLALRARMAAVMRRYDLLAMATVPIEPFEVTAFRPGPSSVRPDLGWLAWAPACHPFNLTGQPALSLPVGPAESGLPVGVQLVGSVGADELVLSIAQQLEAELGPMPAAGDARERTI